MGGDDPTEWQASREWKNISTKWQLTDPASATSRHEFFQYAWSALAEGRLDDAHSGFEEAVRTSEDSDHRVALADVFAARGDWARAATEYERAALLAPQSPLPSLGLALVRLSTGAAANVVEDLQRLAGENPPHPARAYYLALALTAMTVEVRGETRDNRLVILNAAQLHACEDLARRILVTGTGDEQFISSARDLLAEVESGRPWLWARQEVVLPFVPLVLLLGVAPIVFGGLTGNVITVVAGVVVGAGLLYWLVMRCRRQVWQWRAMRVAKLVWRQGLWQTN